jgi:hypothetical protein
LAYASDVNIGPLEENTDKKLKKSISLHAMKVLGGEEI